MASAEQPLKKRKIFEPPPEQSPHTQEPHQSSVVTPPTPPPLSQDEIIARRRNRDEIRSVYDSYKRIKACTSQKDARLMPELEQAYLALITASRGCASVQRIVADLIPRYASYCPTALEAATKVVINMHSWSLAVVNRGEDSDGVAFQTAKACILGLTDICCTSSSEAPSSSVIRGICSAVFQNVLNFFITSFEEKDIFRTVDEDILKMQDSAESFSMLKQKVLDEDESSLIKLSKFRALSFLRILFCCPKNLLAACFELFISAATEEYNKGQFFLRQITHRLGDDDGICLLGTLGDGPKSYSCSTGTSNKASEVSSEKLVADDHHVSEELSPVTKSCLLGLVFGKNPSIKNWMFRKYKKLCNLSWTESLTETLTSLEGIFNSFPELTHVEDSKADSDEDISSPSKYINQPFLVPKISNQHGFPHDSRGTRSMDFAGGDHGDFSHGRSSMSGDLMNHQMVSPVGRAPMDFRSSPFEGRNHFIHVDKNQVSTMDYAIPPLRSSMSPQSVWYFDGDAAAVDIFSASKELWLGALGHDASEAHIRYELERFGPVEHFSFFPMKGFALVEYRSIIDTIRAHEYIRNNFPWRIKFMDVGLGTRGTVNGVAVGSSSYVYVSNILSQWEKDEILRELRRVIYKGRYSVTTLGSECALLVDFETPEEAAAVMAHLRKFRKEKINHLPHSNAGPTNIAMSTMDGMRSLPAPIQVDIRNTDPGNISADSFRMRMSQLSSLVSSLCAKYNINQNFTHYDNNTAGNYHATSIREEDGIPSSTLWIGLPNVCSPFVADDELMSICNLALNNVGSIVRLTRANMQMGCGWFVECSSLDAAKTILKNLRNCPGMFFQIEFSQPARPNTASFTIKPESVSMELVSPRVQAENHGTAVQGGQSFQPNWSTSGSADIPEAGPRKFDGYDNNLSRNPSQRGVHVVSGTEQMRTYKKPESELHPASGSMTCITAVTQGPSLPPPQQIQSSPFLQPVYNPPNSSWDAQGFNHQMPLRPISSSVMMPNAFHGNAVAPPFIPASVTPLAQIQASMHSFEQAFPHPVVPPSLSSIPPPPGEMPPPLPPSPPPPLVPPPPSSPPPPPPPPLTELTEADSLVQCAQYQWQGTLCKSGIHYCTIYAYRINSDICRYSDTNPEPAEWPAKLDMTKRTDFRHVKSTFTSTPPNKRAVCQLIPSSAADNKGFQDFITYLKQRECAGVIKIPAVRSIWARLLFILPYSQEICSLLSIAPNSTDCLIALVLPKETNFEWV